jgi:hypothetical protein
MRSLEWQSGPESVTTMELCPPRRDRATMPRRDRATATCASFALSDARSSRTDSCAWR